MKMKKINNYRFYRSFLVGFGTALAVLIPGKDIAVSHSAVLNSKLHIDTDKRVEIDDGEKVDSEYFKRDFRTGDVEALKTYEKKIAKEIEAEGIVMLKNDNEALPLSSGAKISLLGQGAVKTNYSTSGSSNVGNMTYPTFSEALKENHFDVNQKTLDFYTTGAGSTYGRTTRKMVQFIKEAPWSAYDDETKSSIVGSEAAVVVLARDSGEGTDISTHGSDGLDGTYLSLSAEEMDLLTNLTTMKKNGQIQKLVVLLNSAVPIETDFLFDDTLSIDSCLWIGNVGSEGLSAVSDVLAGVTTPSGHLSDTFLRDNLSSPAMASWMLNPNNTFAPRYENYKDYSLNETQSHYGTYVEGIYVGYRYYETRYEDKVLRKGNAGDFQYKDVVGFPFGYGLSYADFSYSDYEVEEKEDVFHVSLKVTNNSERYSGKEVVQAYLQKPYTDYDRQNQVEKSAVELVGYAKTPLLKPKESTSVSFDVLKETLKTYDSNKAQTYILDQGDYYLSLGNGSHEAINNILAAKGQSKADGMDDEGKAGLAKVIKHIDDLDTSTYSVSVETGKPIHNELDFADINRYENRGDNHVTYVSRNDWQNTFPKTAITLNVASDKMLKDLSSDKEMPVGDAKMPVYNQDNGRLLINLRSTDKVTIEYDNEEWDKLLDQLSFEDQALLVTNAAYNTAALAKIGKPATIDHNGPNAVKGTHTGVVFPSEGIWAASFNDEAVTNVGIALADDALEVSMTGLYAPGLNIHRTPFGGRLNEYFSEDPYLSGWSCVNEVKGMQSKGVIAFAKHFIFNDQETNRSGVCTWLNEQSAREIYLRPFEYTLRKSMGNAHGIMTSFNRAGCVWTSASKELMEDINRDEFDFDGCSITDMASSNGSAYMYYSDGIFNGTDMYDGSGTGNSLDKWKDNPAFCQAVRRATHRILYVVCNFSAAMNGISPTTIIVTITPWWETLLNAFIIASAVGVSASACAMVVFLVLEKRKPLSE